MAIKRVVKGFDLGNVIGRKHLGNWVALSTDYKKVVAFHRNFQKLEKKVGAQDVVYMRAVGRGLDAGYSL